MERHEPPTEAGTSRPTSPVQDAQANMTIQTPPIGKLSRTKQQHGHMPWGLAEAPPTATACWMVLLSIINTDHGQSDRHTSSQHDRVIMIHPAPHLNSHPQTAASHSPSDIHFEASCSTQQAISHQVNRQHQVWQCTPNQCSPGLQYQQPLAPGSSRHRHGGEEQLISIPGHLLHRHPNNEDNILTTWQDDARPTSFMGHCSCSSKPLAVL